jgi:hypothetical protein
MAPRFTDMSLMQRYDLTSNYDCTPNISSLFLNNNQGYSLDAFAATGLMGLRPVRKRANRAGTQYSPNFSAKYSPFHSTMDVTLLPRAAAALRKGAYAFQATLGIEIAGIASTPRPVGHHPSNILT